MSQNAFGLQFCRKCLSQFRDSGRWSVAVFTGFNRFDRSFFHCWRDIKIRLSQRQIDRIFHLQAEFKKTTDSGAF